ncbi:MAG: glycosyltransferase family protein [Phycisphaerales bacterium]
MSVPVWILQRYESRYSLLGAMARELADAFAEQGFPVEDGLPDGSRPGIFIFFNMPRAIEALPAAVRRPGARVAAVQILVDHPLALSTPIMDATSRLPNFRLVLPSIDGLHLLRLRWPTLRHGHMPHGVPRTALIDQADLSREHHRRRPEEVVVAGSIHAEHELDGLRAGLPGQAQPWADEIVELMAAEPHMPFEQAIDLVMGARSVVTGNWTTMAAMWRLTSALLNRRRRLKMVTELQGLRVAVYGGSAWEPHCTGTIRYAGEVGYADLPRALATGRTCLAWGPTQFEHTFSERLLLSMAAGCASVADDRYMIGRHFAFDGPDQAVQVFEARRPGAVRDAFDALLADDARLLAVAAAGRRAVERAHLWQHRVDTIVRIAAEAVTPQPAGHAVRQSA